MQSVPEGEFTPSNLRSHPSTLLSFPHVLRQSTRCLNTREHEVDKRAKDNQNGSQFNYSDVTACSKGNTQMQARVTGGG